VPPAAHRILLALALAAGLGGCAFFGHVVHGGIVAVSAAGGAAFAGPAGAAGGALAGDWAGELAAEHLTGTRGVRVDAEGKVLPSAGAGSLTDGLNSAATLTTKMPSLVIFLLIAALVIAAVGPAAVWKWLQKRLASKEQEDKTWLAVFEAEKARDLAEIESVRSELRELRERLARCEAVASRPPLQP
jgi:hypothetical protein